MSTYLYALLFNICDLILAGPLDVAGGETLGAQAPAGEEDEEDIDATIAALMRD